MSLVMQCEPRRPILRRLLAVGDSEAAKAAGVRCVGVSWGIHPHEKLATLGFDHLIDHPRESIPLTA